MASKPKTLKEQIQSEMIHKFVLGLLEPLTKSDFEYMVENNINIFDFFTENYDLSSLSDNPYANKIIQIIKENKHRIPEYLNEESLFEQMKDHRPDIYEVFNTKKGRLYLKTLIEDINDFLNQLLES